MAFVARLLQCTFTLGRGTFGADGSFNQVKLTGLRARAQIKRAGGPGMSTLSLEVYGVPLTTMNTLSTLGFVATTYRRNGVLIEAGDSNGLGAVFEGTITNAYPDFTSAPDVAFRVEAHTGLIGALAPAPVSSFRGAVDAAQVLAGIAAQWPAGGGSTGVPFENNGVSVILNDPYFYGSLRNQALAVVQHAGISWNGVEDGTLAIWPPGGSRGGAAPLVSKLTGLQGYPSFNSNGIRLRTIFNPSIGFGKNIVVDSALNTTLSAAAANNQQSNQGANAPSTWTVFDMNHDLETLTPHGNWFIDLQAHPVGYIAVPG